MHSVCPKFCINYCCEILLGIQLFRERLFYKRGKLTQQSRKLLWVIVVCFSVVEGNSTKHVYSFFLFSLLLNHFGGLNQTKLNSYYPIAVLWDNLCRNSCMRTSQDHFTAIVYAKFGDKHNAL